MSNMTKEAPLHTSMVILRQRLPHRQKSCANYRHSCIVLLAAGCIAICATENSAEGLLQFLAPYLQTHNALTGMKEGF